MSTEYQQLVDTLPAFLQGSKISFDFNEIRKDLKSFLQNQEIFSDYNFDASGLSFILDILAYNAQMNALTTHLGMNEVFLSSAQARTNVVASANLLSYLPGSFSSATAVLDLTIQSVDVSPPPIITLVAGTKFRGGGFDWITTQTHTAESQNGEYFFYDIHIKEGTTKTVKYFYDSNVDYQRFEIPDGNADISSLSVSVKESEYTSFQQTYNRFSTFDKINENSPVYFIQENAAGRYEIYFLNKGIGIHPKHGSIVELTYNHCSGSAANGVAVFTPSFGKFGNKLETKIITTRKRSAGGGNREDKESIRHNAPFHFQTQNRCVTTQDYISVIKENLPGVIESITAWGGEYNSPPEFGRMYIAIKPFGGNALSPEEKQYILNNIVKPKNVATISPFIVDPEFIWVGLDVVVKYDPAKTINSAAKIEELVRDTIIRFGNKNLLGFSEVLKHSRLLSAIDSTELSIRNSAARVFLVKKLSPNPAVLNQFFVKIPANLYNADTITSDSLISSSPISIGGKRYFIEDAPIPNDVTRRNVQLFTLNEQGKKQIAVNNLGTMNLFEDSLYLYNLKPDTAEEIRLYFEPDSYDIVPQQNQFLRIDESELRISIQSDTESAPSRNR